MLFLAAIAVGTAALSLPAASTAEPLRFVDALFTATSAVCVTGLIVVDTATRLTLFGQLVVLTLIQLGGLGIMTVATALVLSAGGRLSLSTREGLLGSLGTATGLNQYVLIKVVFLTTVIIEGIGAVLLFACFWGDMPPAQAAYAAVFHSISAFCNAGFSVFSNSLENFRHDPITLCVVAGLIICGGLGFVLIGELLNGATHRRFRFSLHSKLCLTTTAVLLAGGTAAFYMAEHEHIFHSSGIGLDIPNAFFQAVTCRTAGFNAVPQTELTELSILISLMLMFIGACPGSTGGGIKTTTVAVIFLIVIRRFTGNRHVSAFERTIGTDSANRALAVFVMAVLVILMMFSLFMFAEEKMLSHYQSHGWFVENLFEVVSAFGTVGLSLGITPRLHDAGKLLLVLLMFTGRVGLLTLAFSLVRSHRRDEIVYAEEEVMVG